MRFKHWLRLAPLCASLAILSSYYTTFIAFCIVHWLTPYSTGLLGGLLADYAMTALSAQFILGLYYYIATRPITLYIDPTLYSTKWLYYKGAASIWGWLLQQHGASTEDLDYAFLPSVFLKHYAHVIPLSLYLRMKFRPAAVEYAEMLSHNLATSLERNPRHRPSQLEDLTHLMRRRFNITVRHVMSLKPSVPEKRTITLTPIPTNGR